MTANIEEEEKELKKYLTNIHRERFQEIQLTKM